RPFADKKITTEISIKAGRSFEHILRHGIRGSNHQRFLPPKAGLAEAALEIFLPRAGAGSCRPRRLRNADRVMACTEEIVEIQINLARDRVDDCRRRAGALKRLLRTRNGGTRA